jgi:hypothetical protein
MNKVTKLGLRTLRRHPKRALRLSLLAVRHRTAVARVVRVGRQGARLVHALQDTAAAHPAAAAGATSALTSLARAGGKARRVRAAGSHGGAEAAADARPLVKHRAEASSDEHRPRTRRRVVLAAALTAGVGAVGGATLAGWRGLSRFKGR